MVETESKGFHAILTPVVINMYTQVLLKRNPGFPIFLLLGLPNFVSTTLSSRKTSNTQETANNFSNKSQARGWLWLAMETWATRAHVCMLCYSEHTKPKERKRTEGTMPSSRQPGESFTVRSSAVFSSFSLSPVPAGVSLHWLLEKQASEWCRWSALWTRPLSRASGSLLESAGRTGQDSTVPYCL